MTTPSFDVWEDLDGLEDSDGEWCMVENNARQLHPFIMKTHPFSSNKYRQRSSSKQKKKGRTARKTQDQNMEEYKQSPRTPITLAEFLSKMFSEKDAESACTWSPHAGGVRTHGKDDEEDTL